MKLPDITMAQVLAVAQAVVAAAVAFGAPINQTQQVALLALAAAVASVLIGADAAIRRARAANADKLRPAAQRAVVTYANQPPTSSASPAGYTLSANTAGNKTKAEFVFPQYSRFPTEETEAKPVVTNEKQRKAASPIVKPRTKKAKGTA